MVEVCPESYVIVAIPVARRRKFKDVFFSVADPHFALPGPIGGSRFLHDTIPPLPSAAPVRRAAARSSAVRLAIQADQRRHLRSPPRLFRLSGGGARAGGAERRAAGRTERDFIYRSSS